MNGRDVISDSFSFCVRARTLSRFTMVQRCVVKFCSNSDKTGHSVHTFPQEWVLRRQWIEFVRAKCADFGEESVRAWKGVCGARFTPQSFANAMMYEMGYAKRCDLHENAVPTIQPFASHEVREKKRAKKRKNVSGTQVAATHSQCSQLQPSSSTSDCGHWPSARQKRKGRAVLKREVLRELHFCTPLSSSMMQAGVCLRQDTETTLPEPTEQHRIRQKEEELGELESVHMAESETECAAPGLNTLEPECVTAHSGELHFCTPLSSSMLQAGVCLRQDTETTLPELTEQHRIRQKEEELSGLESVHMAESETECAAPGLNTLEPECVTAHSWELDFCTPLSSSMLQAGVCLRQDTETTLPELTEQHRIRQKEEELSGLESVHMAESETECAAPGLNTLEPECVTAHSGVSDVHHTHTSLIKTETDLGSTHSGDLIKMESLDSAELGYVTHLHPDQIKTETDDGGYLKVECMDDLQDTQYIQTECERIKHESNEILVEDVMSTVMSGAGVDHKDQCHPWQYAGGPNPNRKIEEIHDALSTSEGATHYCGKNHENNQSR
ncbi:hypothetical protein GJAV_G00141140, partial [Gymnothorax javanicus]